MDYITVPNPAQQHGRTDSAACITQQNDPERSRVETVHSFTPDFLVAMGST
jgi:hypothetical protein